MSRASIAGTACDLVACWFDVHADDSIVVTIDGPYRLDPGTDVYLEDNELSIGDPRRVHYYRRRMDLEHVEDADEVEDELYVILTNGDELVLSAVEQ